jgi:hypothetical protein
MDNLFQNNLGEQGEHPPREMLLLFVDGEVAAKEAGQLEAHLAACWPCRVKTQKIQAAIADIIEFDEQVLTPRLVPPKNWRNFERQLRQLARESGSPSLSSRLFGFLARVQFRLKIAWRSLLQYLTMPLQGPASFPFSSIGRITAFFDRLRLRIAGFSSALSWRFVTLPATLCLVFVGLIIWFGISPSSNISASEILSESERRTAIWENQPDKVLHWGYEVTFTNHLGGLPDGKYISLHWQNNTGGRASRVNRLYDANGVLVSAVWVRKDGSEVYFSRSRADEIRITPTSDVLLSYAARLDEKSRQALKNFVRSSDQVWQMHRESHLEIKQKYINPLEGSVQIIQTADAGKVFRVRSVRLTGKDKSILLEEIDDVAADSFRLLRSHQVIRYPDGKTAITDSQLKLYQETSVEDFDAHDLSAELRQVKRIIQISPEEVLKIAELDEQAKKNNQQAK